MHVESHIILNCYRRKKLSQISHFGYNSDWVAQNHLFIFPFLTLLSFPLGTKYSWCYIIYLYLLSLASWVQNLSHYFIQKNNSRIKFSCFLNKWNNLMTKIMLIEKQSLQSSDKFVHWEIIPFQIIDNLSVKCIWHNWLSVQYPKESIIRTTDNRIGIIFA